MNKIMGTTPLGIKIGLRICLNKLIVELAKRSEQLFHRTRGGDKHREILGAGSKTREISERLAELMVFF